MVRRYTGEQLSRIRMPVGGIGTGCIGLGGRGQLVDWEIANRPARGFTPPELVLRGTSPARTGRR